MIRYKLCILCFSSLLCTHIMGSPVETMRSPALLFPWSSSRVVAGTGDNVSNAFEVVDFSTQAALDAFCREYINDKYPESGYSPSADEISEAGHLIRKYIANLPDTNAVVSAEESCGVLKKTVFFDVTGSASKPETGAWVLLSDGKHFQFGSIPFWSDQSSYDVMWREVFGGKTGFLVCQSEATGSPGLIEFGNIVNGLRHGEWTTIYCGEESYRWYNKYDMGKDISNAWSPDFAGESIFSLESKAPTGAMHLSWTPTSVGDFNEEESPSAVWVLRNDTSRPFVIMGVLRVCEDLMLEYCGANSQWVSVGANNENLPYSIPPGEDGRIRVTVKPFSRVGRFSNVVHLVVDGYEELMPLTVCGGARRLVESNPSFPMKISNDAGGSVPRIEAKLMPRKPCVVVGIPYVTNAIVPTVINLKTNALPWTLEVQMDVANDYMGPLGCDVVLPILFPSNHVSQTYVCYGKTGDYAAVQKRDNAMVVDWFAPYDLKLFFALEREIFLKLDLDPGYRVVRHFIGSPEEMQLLQARIKVFGGIAKEFPVVLMGGELLEGEAAIREKLLPLVQTGDWLSAGKAALKEYLRDEEANPKVKPSDNVVDW